MSRRRAKSHRPLPPAVVAPAAPRRTSVILPSYAGGYQGAASSRTRSWLPGQVTDSRHEVTQYTRTELMRKARYFRKNIGMVRGVAKSLVDHAIGPGIYPIPATRDDAWNERAWDWFWELAKIAEVSGKMTLWEVQRMRTMAKFFDGEMFTLLVQSAAGWPQMQIVRAHNCGNFDVDTSEGWVDGVRLDSVGRARAYRFRLRGDDNFATVPGRSVVHSYILEDTDQVRGVTPLAAAINSLHDVMDTLALEKDTMKELARRAAVVTNSSGESEDPASHFTPSSDDPDPGITEKLTRVLGAEVTHLATGETLKAFEFNRPGPNTLQFLDYIGRDITTGTGFPYEFAWNPIGMTGPGVRYVMEKVKHAVREWQRNEIEDTLPFYTFAIALGMEMGELPRHPEWWRVDWLPGAVEIGIDAGNASASAIDQVKSALNNFKRHFAAQGLWWKTELRQKAKEAAFIRDLAREYDVPEDRIHQLTVNSGATSEVGAPTQRPEDDDQS